MFNIKNISKLRASNLRNPSAGSSTVFLVEEYFEGAGTPPNFTFAGTANPDYTSTILQGSQSAALADGDFIRADLGQEYSELWGKYQVRHIQNGILSNLFILYSDVFAIAGNIYRWVGDTMLGYHGAISDGSTDTLDVNTTYYVWWHWKQGTGSDGILEAWFDTVNVRPTTGGSKYIGIFNGEGTAATRYFECGAGNDVEFVIDSLQIAETEFQ